MKWILTAILIASGSVFSQWDVFGTSESPNHKATITNTTATTSRWIELSHVHKLEGMASLFVAGDLKTGSHSEGMKVEMQVACCITPEGDTLGGDWQTIETVSTTYLGLTIGTGTLLVGRQLSLGNMASTWNKFHLIRFRFSFATSTHTTDVVAILTLN